MVILGLVAPLAGNDYPRDRSSEVSPEVVTTRRVIATALSYRPVKLTVDE